MRLEQLIYLTEVIDCGSMRQAADNLFTSVQNISKSIRELEQELGVQLLVRSHFGTTPTGDGQLVYEKALEVRKNVEAIQAHYQDISVHLDKTQFYNVRIASVSSMTIRLRHIASLVSKKEAPIGLSLYEYEGKVLNDLLLNQAPQLDHNDFVFFASGEHSLIKYKDLLRSYELYVLGSNKLGISLNANNPLTKNREVQLKHLKQIPLAAFQSSLGGESMFYSVLAENGYLNIPKPIFVSNLHEVCNDYVRQNPRVGVLCCVPDALGREAIASEMHDRTILPFKENISIVHLMAQRKNAALSPEATVFRRYTLDYFKDTCYRLSF
jgi:DNA-binding transcriptional LysR family regulator